VDMRIPPIAVLPLLMALVALLMAIFSMGASTSLVLITVALAIATVLVTFATFFQYTKKSTEAKQVPLENFSLWADVGEPAAELRRLSYDDVEAAVRIVSADLGSLAANAELLSDRLSMLVGKEGFEEIRQERLNKLVESTAQGISSVVDKLRSSGEFSAGVVSSLEQYASNSDRIANKLFEFERGKSEVVHVYIDPLRRAAEKLSRDLRLASSNISNYMQGVRLKEKAT